MKRILFIGIVLLSVQNAKSQFAINASYQNSIVNMRPAVSDGNGFDLKVFYGPNQKRLNIGIAVARSYYGAKRAPVQFTAYDGSVVNTNVKVNNNYTNVGLYSRYKLAKGTNNILTPFIESKLGYGFLSTRINIEEPMDITNCDPVQPNTVYQDKTWTAYGGMGLDLKLTGLITKEKENRSIKTYLTFSAGYSTGGRISYFNPEHADMSGGQHSGSNSKSGEPVPYYAAFMNTQTQTQHEHAIGYLYTSSLSMAEFKLGFSLRF